MSAPVLASSLAPAVSSNQKLTVQELEQGRLFLRQTYTAIIGATKGLSRSQWTFKPANDRWSIAENLDHIVTVQERVLGPILSQLANAPAPSTDRPNPQIDAVVIHQFPTRLNKFSAPEFVRPADQISPLELLDRMSANCARLMECLQTTAGLREHVIDSAPLKGVSKGAYDTMDGYQWILAAAAHTERHAKQVLEVKADDHFPVG